MVKPTFDGEAIQAALSEANLLDWMHVDPDGGGIRQLRGMDMERVLRAAYERQAEGDTVLRDMTTRVEGLRAEIASLEARRKEIVEEADRLEALGKIRSYEEEVEIRESLRRLIGELGESWWAKASRAHESLRALVED